MIMVKASRRNILRVGLGASLIANASVPAVSNRQDASGIEVAEADLMADMATYNEAGDKRAGGPGDSLVGDWLIERVMRSDYTVERQMFRVPHFEVARSAIKIGPREIPVLPLALSLATPREGITGPLRELGEPSVRPGALAVIDLPHRRWSKADIPAIREPVRAAFAEGCAAAILITNGPTGQAVALNVPAGDPMFAGPVAILAPKNAGPVRDGARRGETARLQIDAHRASRPAFNVIARLERAEGLPWLAVSTPRSGWTACVGERGPGIVIWLALAEWAARACTRHNLFFVCNSGHEYENLGASHVLGDHAPSPSETAFWLHLGANVATRDWHEVPGDLYPLPSADPQRFLLVSDNVIESARRIFTGQPGLEVPYSLESGAAGELAEIIAAGYTSVAGVFGAHRFHHVASDDMRTISPSALGDAARGFRALVEETLTHF